MGRQSRDKGARGEREFALFLTERGFEAYRGRQFQGGEDSPDVICKPLKNIHFEVKRTEKLSVYPALDQAIADGGESNTPIVDHRSNEREWLAILRAEDLLEM